MRNVTLDSMSDVEVIEAVGEYGGANSAARNLNIPKSTFKDRYARIRAKAYKTQSHIETETHVVAPTTQVFIFSSAQNNTEIDASFLANLEAYAAHRNAKIMISGYVYSKTLFGDPDSSHANFHPSIQKYLVTKQIDVGGKLLFCAEMNTLPTAVEPLSGFEAYTRSKWGVFPHPRISLKTIPTMHTAGPKHIMTTGSVTLPNYVHKKAGIKAEFHHVIAAVVVELDAQGDIFCRHLVAEKDGAFQDLNTRVTGGAVLSTPQCVEAITWGDIHADRLDYNTALGSWGILPCSSDIVGDNMLDDLQPRYQFFHDVLDFRRRNHHNIGDPYHRYKMHIDGTDSVQEELDGVGAFLKASYRPWSISVVVSSNHDRALVRWLKNADYKADPVNALVFLELQYRTYLAMTLGDEKFSPLSFYVKTRFNIPQVEFLTNMDSFLICKHAGGGIECAIHGDQGANGAKGHVNSFARMGPKANTADKHAAEIFEGIYQAGHSCTADMVYNRGGLSGWSPSHIVTYPSGKRTIITMQGDKYHAE